MNILSGNQIHNICAKGQAFIRRNVNHCLNLTITKLLSDLSLNMHIQYGHGAIDKVQRTAACHVMNNYSLRSSVTTILIAHSIGPLLNYILILN